MIIAKRMPQNARSILFRKIIWPLISFSCSISLCFDAVSLILWFHYKKGGRHPHTSLPITGVGTLDG